MFETLLMLSRAETSSTDGSRKYQKRFYDPCSDRGHSRCVQETEDRGASLGDGTNETTANEWTPSTTRDVLYSDDSDRCFTVAHRLLVCIE